MTQVKRTSTAVLTAVVCAAGGAAAQAGVAVSAGITFADHRVDAGYGVERHHGILPGIAVSLLPSPQIAVALRARRGTLAADRSGWDRKFSEVGVLGRFQATEWLALDGGLTARHFSNALGGQRWLLLRAGVEGRLPMFAGAGGGILRASYSPLAHVRGLSTELALTAGAGLEYNYGPARMRVLYEVERFRFVPTAAPTRRHEQLSSITAELSVVLNRP